MLELRRWVEENVLLRRLLFQPDYDDIEDDYGRAMKHPMMEEKRSKHDDRKKYGEECNAKVWKDWLHLIYHISFVKHVP